MLKVITALLVFTSTACSAADVTATAGRSAFSNAILYAVKVTKQLDHNNAIALTAINFGKIGGSTGVRYADPINVPTVVGYDPEDDSPMLQCLPSACRAVVAEYERTASIGVGVTATRSTHFTNDPPIHYTAGIILRKNVLSLHYSSATPYAPAPTTTTSYRLIPMVGVSSSWKEWSAGVEYYHRVFEAAATPRNIISTYIAYTF